MHRIYNNSKSIIPKVFGDSQVQQLLNETFDLVIIEEVFVDALKVFAWHFKAHLIVFHPHRSNFWVNDNMGNPCLPAYISEYPSTFGVAKNFIERVENVMLYVLQVVFKEFVYLKEHSEISQKYFPSSPQLSDIVYNTSLAFMNSDISIHQSVPTLPNMIDIGGFHIKNPKPLPIDVLKFCNNSTKGVVFIDMDFVTSSYMHENIRNSMMNVLSKLHYNVLWIWDEMNFPNKPSNLMLQYTLPLGDVLAHPNIKLFIHLGNMKDIIESVFYGVPQLLIPVLDDQLYDTAQAQYYGYAKLLPYSKLNEKSFHSAVEEILNNTKYTEESQRRSKILKEKPISSKKIVAFWIDNVLRTNGASYMRASSLDYPWYQLYLIDVLGMFFGIILIVILLLKMVINFICRICCRCKRKKDVNRSAYSLTSIAE
ncbi:UDP-glycosyltransferase UGT5-like isoform X2 [Harmonia axyridis]|nr:UDP-glycosyltransferase UGT5-like isoform X2 [Harmonia axyridis]